MREGGSRWGNGGRQKKRQREVRRDNKEKMGERERGRQRKESSQYLDGFSIQSFWDYRQSPECSDVTLIRFFFISAC